ncbi:ABC-type dipeptide/oligopeptide/nickel transport system, permease component [Sanguibacter keddieii DSM 10542]|uniref:ABC-type dipeptide/oligopeptide/nickel transport system, permease component n=1 Tax=Sanguibacter keddieii (strain ATCC 51767 / DSM 10542 / NCFB 3025 / ST-74) TaxID=446469 RepID=D1BF69_SANKS|nr:ABC transporter permease [Sanguibacter keddieii]ACZ21365.1 ABC-type dipeptide/oligopeptide/nickel transport system, permease component [Sanguibacter keddieii DSM 10542]
MIRYVLRRVLIAVPVLFLISIAAFAIIQLPPGDYLTTYVAGLQASGQAVNAAQVAQLAEQYGLNQPIWVQYLKWIGNVLQGDFGTSFEWNQPVSTLLAERLPLTIVLAVTTLLFTWLLAFPAGIYSALRQYSWGDYSITVLAFLGIAVPNFLIALVLAWISSSVFGQPIGGLFSAEYVDASWNLGKVLDLLAHIWVPIVVLGAAGTAGLMRILRANLLDELRRPYVTAARARGIPERRLIVRYPLRVALNPFISTIGWVLPALISGEVIVAQVLALPTTGPLLVSALTSQDMFLAGSIILIISTLTVIGSLVSDVALALLDPRIRLSYQ